MLAIVRIQTGIKVKKLLCNATLIVLHDQYLDMMNLIVISVVLCTLTLCYAAPVRVNLTLPVEMSKRSSPQGIIVAV